MTDNDALNQLLELVFVVVSATVGIIFLFVYQSLFGVVLACILPAILTTYAYLNMKEEDTRVELQYKLSKLNNKNKK